MFQQFWKYQHLHDVALAKTKCKTQNITPNSHRSEPKPCNDIAQTDREDSWNSVNCDVVWALLWSVWPLEKALCCSSFENINCCLMSLWWPKQNPECYPNSHRSESKPYYVMPLLKPIERIVETVWTRWWFGLWYDLYVVDIGKGFMLQQFWKY